MTIYVCELKDKPHKKVTPSALSPYIKAYGVSKLAREIGVSREGLSRSFSAKGNPRVRTVFAVIRQLKLHACFGIREQAEASEGDKGQ